MKKILPLLVLLLLIPTIHAQEGHIYQLPLLAVQETVNTTHIGSKADLFLELKEGSGRVFLDTSPIPKMDTQISTRFAKEIACEYFNLNCDKYDFIYTIEAHTNIIGGPSAGAAIAALTTIAVLDLDYNQKVAITGTINSGGIVGQVGGVKEKLEAAAKVNVEKALIPKGSSAFTMSTRQMMNESNISEPLDLVEYSKNNLSLDTIEVVDINDVIYELTGEKLIKDLGEIKEDSQYTQIMQQLQESLCQRADKVELEINKANLVTNQTEYNLVKERLELASNETKAGNYYAAASYCFSSNIELKSYYYKQKKFSKGHIHVNFERLKEKTNALKNKLDQQKIETISDLQTLIVVKERINDVEEQLSKYEKERTILTREELYNLLAYAEERLFSALSWMQFFEMDGKKFILDEQNLQRTCQQKISEAKERVHYADLFVSGFLTLQMKEKNEQARIAQENKDYALCLSIATQAKAEANALLGSIGLRNETLTDYFESKATAAERVISKNSKEGTFPILGYSYYQYASSLYPEQKYTALLYEEYALEMSDLSIYFPEEKSFLTQVNQKWSISDDIILILQGFLIGVLATLLIIWVKPELLIQRK